MSYGFFCRENDSRTSSGKFLRVESCHPESSDFLGLWETPADTLWALVVHNAIVIPALMNTYGPIQERNLSSVTSATILALCLVSSKYTSTLTPENTPKLAINAVSKAKHPHTFRSTR